MLCRPSFRLGADGATPSLSGCVSVETDSGSSGRVVGGVPGDLPSTRRRSIRSPVGGLCWSSSSDWVSVQTSGCPLGPNQKVVVGPYVEGLRRTREFPSCSQTPGWGVSRRPSTRLPTRRVSRGGWVGQCSRPLDPQQQKEGEGLTV